MSPSIPKTTKLYRLPASQDQYTDATALRIVEEEIKAPANGEVLVKVYAVSVNARDVMVSKKQFPGAYPADLIPCSDAAGEVIAVGEGVTKFAVGDRVINTFFALWGEGRPKAEYFGSARGGAIQGVLSQYYTFADSELVAIPEYLSYEEASTIPCTGVTAYNALFSQGAPINSSSAILALGTGHLTITAVQLAKAVGARAIVTSSSDDKIDKLKSYGAYAGVNYTKTPEWAPEVRKLTEGGKGVDHVLENGGAATLLQSIQSAGMDGNVHLIGSSASGNDPAVAWIAGSAIFGAVHVHGIFVGSREHEEKLVKLFAEHKIHPPVDKVFPFEEAAEAFAYQAKGTAFGKVVIKVQ